MTPTTIKVKYNLWDCIETLFDEIWYIEALYIWKLWVTYHVWFKGDKYAYLKERQMKKSNQKEIWFKIQLEK